MPVRVQYEDFDLSAEVAALRAGRAQVGAVACFVGTVRDINQGTGVPTRTLEHYPGMTAKPLEAFVKSAQERRALDGFPVSPRIRASGALDQIVLGRCTPDPRSQVRGRVELRSGCL